MSQGLYSSPASPARCGDRHEVRASRGRSEEPVKGEQRLAASGGMARAKLLCGTKITPEGGTIDAKTETPALWKTQRWHYYVS